MWGKSLPKKAKDKSTLEANKWKPRHIKEMPPTCIPSLLLLAIAHSCSSNSCISELHVQKRIAITHFKFYCLILFLVLCPCQAFFFFWHWWLLSFRFMWVQEKSTSSPSYKSLVWHFFCSADDPCSQCNRQHGSRRWSSHILRTLVRSLLLCIHTGFFARVFAVEVPIQISDSITSHSRSRIVSHLIPDPG